MQEPRMGMELSEVEIVPKQRDVALNLFCYAKVIHH